ncbi:unnamed protein product [Bursaphelenchus xylophilus]|uniref:Peroxisomal ATPase PEX1 n=1 Tax=Bursaphelenchus xylophilus TaxID=6326 RepID=A0A1I7SM22_BURXY|nr:unnamed protein product [Bursaphelenchus xylophilus]CAG9129968.1 unnamed protein product [Bursaphelenchus xylophilus]
MAIVVRVVEHKSPNCYGFLSNFPNKFIESSSFAVFKCSRVEAPETSFALQVFASKPPFEYLHLNRVFIQRLGLNLNDQLILEQVRDVNYCQWMEIKPETFEDWNIVENTSEVIEEDFLRQLRVVQEDLPFVLFLSSGISINFKVVQIGPKLPKGAPALISNATQVMVAPLSQPKLSEYSSGCNHPDILHDSVSLFNPLRFFISPGKPQMTLRILPKVYLKTLKVKLPNSTVVTIGNENYVKTTIYRVIRPGATSIYINLVVLPKRSTALYGNLETIHDVLSKLPNGHCYISYDLQQQGLQPFMRILCFPVNEYEIRPLKTILYSSSVLLKPRSLEMALKDAFKNNLYVPFLISGAGCEVALANPDGHFKVKLIPTEGIDATKQCGVFLMDKLPEFRQSEHEIKIPPSPEQKTVHNFGEKPSKLQSFQFQSTFSAEILVYLSTICQQHECNGFNTLICGEEFSGKTTILEILSASLYQKLKVFSLKVDCNEFKGKSPDNIALFLDQKLRYLQNRWPSVLFLDEFDFLNKEFEDEERSKFISKVYLKISSLITDYKIPVVATARSYHFLSSDALTFNGRRFFTLVKEMPQLDQVSYG